MARVLFGKKSREFQLKNHRPTRRFEIEGRFTRLNAEDAWQRSAQTVKESPIVSSRPEFCQVIRQRRIDGKTVTIRFRGPVTVGTKQYNRSDLAEELGVTLATVSRILNGSRRSSVSMLSKLASALGLSLEGLVKVLDAPPIKG